MARDDVQPVANTPEELTLAEMAREELDKAENDIEKAVIALRDRIMDDVSLVRDNLQKWIENVARQRVALVFKNRRTMIERVHSDFGTALASAMEAEFTRFMEMPLFGGMPLGRSTAADVRESAAQYEKMSSTAARRARWQYAVAEAAEKNADRSDATISQTLSEATLAKLWEASSGN